MKYWPALALLCACGCSGSKPLKPEQVASEQRALRSLEREKALLERLIQDDRLPERFARAHARYLAEATEEHEKKLSPPPQ